MKKTILFLVCLLNLPTLSLANSVDVGLYHSCAISPNQSITCWGEPVKHAQETVEPPEGNFLQLSANMMHTCGLKTDNTIMCWGKNQENQLDAPSTEFIQVIAGRYHSCGLQTDNKIICWGEPKEKDDFGQLDAPTDNFQQISAGWHHTCGLRFDNTVLCWGRSDNPWNNNAPANIGSQLDTPPDQFSQITSGGWHNCGIRLDGSVYCWGHNGDGQGDVPEGQFIQIHAGTYTTCGVRDDHALVCWGWNKTNQAKPPSSTCIKHSDNWPKVTCTTEDKDFAQVAVGDSGEIAHSCAVKLDNTIVCWGNNEEKQTKVPDALSASTNIDCDSQMCLQDKPCLCFSEQTSVYKTGDQLQVNLNLQATKTDDTYDLYVIVRFPSEITPIYRYFTQTYQFLEIPHVYQQAVISHSQQFELINTLVTPCTLGSYQVFAGLVAQGKSAQIENLVSNLAQTEITFDTECMR